MNKLIKTIKYLAWYLGLVVWCKDCGSKCVTDDEKFDMGYGLDHYCTKCGEKQ